jgi:hypothetical protein
MRKSVRKSTRWVNMGDLHFGWSKRTSPQGRQTKTPIHDLTAFQTTLEFIKAYQPDTIGLMGDMVDMKPVCRHELDQPKKLEGQRLVETYEKFDDLIIKPLLETGAEITWMDGNHEAWAYALTNKFPGLDGMLDPYSYLKLRQRGIRFIPQGGVLQTGKLSHMHGDTLIRGGGKHAAAMAVDKFGSSIRVWHFHTKQFHTRATHKNGAYISGACVPCLCDRGPSYQLTHINSWVKGFEWGVAESNGTFWDDIAVIWQGRTTINGKVYG